MKDFKIRRIFKKCTLILICRILLITSAIHGQQTGFSFKSKDEVSMRKMLFDNNWRFHKGGAQGAEDPNFTDTNWQKIDLPHDWSIEDLPFTKSPFNPNAIDQASGGFTTGGTGWYRKTFVVPILLKLKKLQIQFDGIYMNADVWINGKYLGNHPYGYTSFWYDITDKINFGKKNIIAVQVKNEGKNSRWYSGSGIYRHVWLKTVEPIHILQRSTSVTTSDESLDSARINFKTQVENESNESVKINVVTNFFTFTGAEVCKLYSNIDLGVGEKKEINEQNYIKNPKLWSPESPVLYKAVTKIYLEGKAIDSERIPFGIRKISFDVQNGFRLNGKTIKLKGGCFHDDNGPLGAKAYDRAEERKVEILKANGYNAVRCAHNPPSPAFLDACDRLGIFVIDEAFDMWNYGKNPYDYHLYFENWWQKDIESMIRRDRNHPCVIMWSIGNEIQEGAKPEGIETAKKLAQFVRKLDPTRPVTSAVNNRTNKDPFLAQLDVAGYNYAVRGNANVYESDHLRFPNRIIVGTESFPTEAFGSWMAVENYPYLIGDFVWTAFDYIGEASIGWLDYPQKNTFYPWNLAFCGDIDICGWKRPQSYYRDVLWKRNQLSLFVKPPKPSFDKSNPKNPPNYRWSWDDVVADWNWKGYENSVFKVSIYSSCDEVELFLNNKSLGEKLTNRSNKYIAVYNVPYQPGELKAVGYDNGKLVNTSILKTANEPIQIKLFADRNKIKANNEDLSYVTVELLDANGVRNPKSENLIHFTIYGPGNIAGVGNANPISTESYTRPERKAWKGRCMVIIKSTIHAGKIILKASGNGLKPNEITINSQ